MKNYKQLDGFALIFAIVFAFILPPVSVFIKRGEFDTSFWINVLLLFCGYALAPIHAFYVLFFKED